MTLGVIPRCLLLRSDLPVDSGRSRKVIGLAPESVIGFDRNQ